MMAMKSIRDKIASLASGETLGETESNNLKSNTYEHKAKPQKPSRKSTKELISKNIKSKSIKTKNDKSLEVEDINKKEVAPQSAEIRKANQINTVNNSIEGYEDVLSILGVKETMAIDVDFKSDELDYIEFTQTTPLGFDFDEVTDFISRAKYTLYKLENALIQRDRDIVLVASEVKKVEQKMIDRNHEKELSKMLGGMTEEERLITDNMDLKVRINNLERERIELLNDLDQAHKENEALSHLEIENKELKNKLGKNQNAVSDTLTQLPVMTTANIKTEDPFDKMIRNIGGFYDE